MLSTVAVVTPSTHLTCVAIACAWQGIDSILTDHLKDRAA